MSILECDRLDDYLLGGLSKEETAGFEAHLDGCPACRDELEQQERIDALLAQGSGQSEPVPAALIDRIEEKYCRSDRRRAARWAWGLSAAAMVLVGLVAWLATGGFGTGNRHQPVAQDHPQPKAGGKPVDWPGRDAPPARPLARVSFDDPSGTILVPLETKATNVSVFWIYPTVGPVQRPEGPRDD